MITKEAIEYRQKPYPQTETQGAGAGSPPRKTGVGTLEPRGREPGMTDGDLIMALNGQPLEELPGLEEILDRYGLEPATQPATNIPKRDVRRFVVGARQRGLTQPPLSTREYILAILPQR